MMLYLFGMWENGSRGDGIQNRKGDWVRFRNLITLGVADLC